MRRIVNISDVDIVIVAVIVLLPLIILIPTGAIPIGISLLLVYILPRYWYKKSEFYTLLGQGALAVAYIVMAFLFIINHWQATVQMGSVDAPWLLNDSLSFYRLSYDIVQGGIDESSPKVPYFGYPAFLSFFLLLGINDIAYPVICNILLLLCSMIMVGRCVMLVVDDKPMARSISGYAMALMAMVPGVMGYGSVLSKEPFVVFAIVTSVGALYAIRRRNHTILNTLLLLLSIVILTACRASYLYVMLLLVIGVYACKPKVADILPFVCIVFAVVCAIYIGSQASYWGSSDYVLYYVNEEYSTSFFCGESQAPFEEMIGPYNTYPHWMRILLLPVTIVVQFMIPFPFETVSAQEGLPLSTAYHRMSYLWYIAALPMIAYYVFYLLRGRGGQKLLILSIWAAISYCIPAYITAGTTSRYAYCFVPILAIMGGYVLYSVLDNRRELNRLMVFAIIYIVLIIAALYLGAHPQVILRYI